MLRRFCALMVVALALMPCSGFAADIAYTCKDRNGKVLAGNGAPENDCASDICTTVNGKKKCEHEEPAQAEENAPDPQAERRHKQWLSDIALLERYSSEQQIDNDRQKELQPVQDRIKKATQSLQDARNVREGKYQNEMEFYPTGNYPSTLRDELDANDETQEEANKTISDGEAEMVTINKKYDDDIKRYRKLKKVGAAAAPK